MWPTMLPSCNRLSSATSLLVMAVSVGLAPLYVAGEEADVPTRRDALDFAREQAMKKRTGNNLKRLIVAMHDYAGLTKTAAFPPAFSSKDGQPLLSWRVALLPYIGQKALYEEFHLDEPWDSEHNKALITKMPDAYLAPTSRHKDGRTVYLTPRGDQTVFPGDKLVPFQQITDGLSNTIAIVEFNDDFAVPWTKPDDWKFDPDHPSGGVRGAKNRLKALLEQGGDTKVKPLVGDHYTGGFYAAFCDGAVRFISDKASDANVRLAFIRNDGENVRFDFDLIGDDGTNRRPTPPSTTATAADVKQLIVVLNRTNKKVGFIKNIWVVAADRLGEIGPVAKQNGAVEALEAFIANTSDAEAKTAAENAVRKLNSY